MAGVDQDLLLLGGLQRLGVVAGHASLSSLRHRVDQLAQLGVALVVGQRLAAAVGDDAAHAGDLHEGIPDAVEGLGADQVF